MELLKAQKEKVHGTRDNCNPIPTAALTQDAQIFEYSKAANPIKSGSTPRIPIKEFSADLYASGASRVIPLDLGSDLRVPYPATGPSLLASFVRVNAQESITTCPNASSEFFFIIRGRGRSEIADGSIAWEAGDFVVLPVVKATHFANEDSALYMVNDSPLFAYLGA